MMKIFTPLLWVIPLLIISSIAQAAPNYILEQSPYTTLANNGSNSGQVTQFRCPAGKAIRNFRAYADNFLRGIEFDCRSVEPDGSPEWGNTQGLIGNTGGTFKFHACEDWIVGFTGRSGSLIDRISASCATAAQIQLGLQGTSSTASGEQGGGPFQQYCGLGYVATGANIRVGNDHIRSIQAVCSRLVDQVLTVNTPKKVPNSSTGVSTYYTFNAPYNAPYNAQDIRFSLTGGSGNADLYIARGYRPTLNTYSCRSAETSNTESCDGEYSGTYHVMVHAKSAFTNVTLEADYVLSLSNDIPETSLKSDTLGDMQHFTFDAPARATNVLFTLKNQTGDPDLYVKKGSQPSKQDYDCRPYKGSNQSESCRFDAGGQYHIMVQTFSPYSGADLEASYSQRIINKQLVSGLSDSNPKNSHYFANNQEFFTIDVPENSGPLRIETTGADGNIDLYVSHGSEATLNRYDCRSRSSGNFETCVINDPQPGTYHILLDDAGIQYRNRSYSFQGLPLKSGYKPFIGTDTTINLESILQHDLLSADTFRAISSTSNIPLLNRPSLPAYNLPYPTILPRFYNNVSLVVTHDEDSDGDGVRNLLDAFPNNPEEWKDSDGDGVGNNSDNCPITQNTNQLNSDDHPFGDACQSDILANDDTHTCFLSPSESGAGTEGMCPSSAPILTISNFSASSQLVSQAGVNQGYRLILNSRGQLVILDGANKTHWSTPFSSRSTAPHAYARVLENDVLALFNKNDEQYWSTPTAHTKASHFILRNDGVLYLECADGQKVWKSHGSATLIDQCSTKSDWIKSIETAEKIALVNELLCSNDEDLNAVCPNGSHYQFLSLDDSYLSISNQDKILNDIAYGSGAGFLYDAWNSSEVVNPQCLDSHSLDANSNTCFDSNENIRLDSLFITMPEGMEVNEKTDDNGSNQFVSYDNKDYLVNVCYRHQTNNFYFDSLDDVRNYSRDRDAFLQRYYPYYECKFNSINKEKQAVKPYSEYKNKFIAAEATALQVVKTAEEVIIVGTAIALTDGFVGFLLAETELATAWAALQAGGQLLGLAQGVQAVLSDYAELGGCQSSACRNKVITDMVTNSLMIAATVAEKGYGGLKEYTKAQSVAKSMLRFSDEAFTEGTFLTTEELPVSLRQKYRIMVLAAADENFSRVIKYDINNNEILLKSIIDLPEILFNDDWFMEKLFSNIAKIDSGETYPEALVNELESIKKMLIDGASCGI